MSIPDDYGKRRGEGNRDLPAFMKPKDVDAPRPRPVDLDKFDAELDRVKQDLNQRVGQHPLGQIADFVLALTYGQMVEMVGEIAEVSDGKLDSGALAPILYKWAHEKRGAMS